ncbi:hypothetical protein [Rubellicoccus peritrichatus]|uniref:Uncharacterized protein n=1 Tax=Rubellicoccus peritrichatus TaxID=3080537 RepID=A0AAQ3QR87_9BACT|nr:hypothetical protein [Puniceicoccus sp. CR14]WOO41063.1 hypothetical protein RZN69_20785 [Puniceicoccus sp. CR14]
MKSPFLTIFLTAIITAILTSAFWIAGITVGYVYYTSNYFIGDTPDFAVSVDSPEQVRIGEEFDLVVKVSNPSEEDLKLGSIDIYDSLLDGFKVLEVIPKPNEEDSIFEFRSFYFSEELKPQDSVTITFKLKGAKAGVWTGDIDSCTPWEQFVTSVQTIVVSAE